MNAIMLDAFLDELEKLAADPGERAKNIRDFSSQRFSAAERSVYGNQLSTEPPLMNVLHRRPTGSRGNLTRATRSQALEIGKNLRYANPSSGEFGGVDWAPRRAHATWRRTSTVAPSTSLKGTHFAGSTPSRY